MLRLLTDPGRLDPGAAAAWRAPAVEPPSRRAPPPAGRTSAELDFSAASLPDVRRLVALEAERAQLGELRRSDLVLAVDELASNSVVHGGGRGRLRVWRAEGAIVCEVCDRGHISDPLLGRRRPTPEQIAGRGLWVVSHLCDRVHICSAPGRTTVRVQMTET